MTALGVISQYGTPDGLDVPTGTTDAGDPYWSGPLALPAGYTDTTVIPAGSLLVFALATSYEAAGDVTGVFDSQGSYWVQFAESDLSDALTANVTVWQTVTETDLDPATDTLSFSFLDASYTALSSTLFWSASVIWIGAAATIGVSDSDSDVAGGAVTALPATTVTALTSRDTEFLVVEVLAETGVPITDFTDEVVMDAGFTLIDSFEPVTGTPTEAFAIRFAELADLTDTATYTPTDGTDWATDGPNLSYASFLVALRTFNTLTSTVRPPDPVDAGLLDYIATATGRLISEVTFDDDQTFVTGDIDDSDQAAVDAALTAYVAGLPEPPPTESDEFLELRDTLIPALADPGEADHDERLRNLELALLDTIWMLIEPPSELSELREAVLDTPQVAPVIQSADAAIDEAYVPTDVHDPVPGLSLDVEAGHLYDVQFVVRYSMGATGDLALGLQRTGDAGIADSVTVTTTQHGDGVAVSATQQAVFTGYPSGGTFTISIDEQTTVPITWDVTATLFGDIETAVGALSTVPAGVSVNGGALYHDNAYASVLALTFGGFTDVPEMVLDASGLTNVAVETDTFNAVRSVIAIAEDTEQVFNSGGSSTFVFDAGALAASPGGINGYATLSAVVRAFTSGTLELLAWQTAGGETGIYPDSFGTLRVIG